MSIPNVGLDFEDHICWHRSREEHGCSGPILPQEVEGKVVLIIAIYRRYYDEFCMLVELLEFAILIELSLPKFLIVILH